MLTLRRSRCPARTCSPLPVPRPRARARAGHRAVRAADGRRRHRVPRCSARRTARRLGLDQSVWAILLAHVFFNYAVVVRTVGGLWSHLDPRPEEAARVLGASRWRAFREVTLPALRPGDRRGRRDRVPVLLHVVRRDPRARRPAVRDARDRDLPPDRAAPRPAARRRARRSCSSSPSSSLLVGHRADSSGRRTRSRSGCAPHARAARRPALAATRVLLAANLARDGRRCSGSRSRCSSSGRSHPPAATASASTARSTRSTRGSTLFVPPIDAIVELAALRGGRHGHRGRRRWLRRVRRRAGARGGAGLDARAPLPLGVSAVTVGFGFLIALDEPPLDLRGSRGSSRSRRRSSRSRSSCAS